MQVNVDWTRLWKDEHSYVIIVMNIVMCFFGLPLRGLKMWPLFLQLTYIWFSLTSTCYCWIFQVLSIQFPGCKRPRNSWEHLSPMNFTKESHDGQVRLPWNPLLASHTRRAILSPWGTEAMSGDTVIMVGVWAVILLGRGQGAGKHLRMSVVLRLKTPALQVQRTRKYMTAE